MSTKNPHTDEITRTEPDGTAAKAERLRTAVSERAGRVRARTKAFTADARAAAAAEPAKGRRALATGAAALATGALAVTGWRRLRARRAARRNPWVRARNRLDRAARRRFRRR